MTAQAPEKQLSTNELAQIRNSLAFERTRLGSDRTSMAYLRTAISLVGFGFSIPAFFQVLSRAPGFENVSAMAPRVLGVALLSLATVMLVVAIVQQTLFLRRLERESGMKQPFSIALASCVFVLAVALASITYIVMTIGHV